MGQYQQGQVSLTFGSNRVVGNDTLWLGRVRVGDAFIIPSLSATFSVGEIVSDTVLHLTAPWSGPDLHHVRYAIHRDFTPNGGIPIPIHGDIATYSVLSRAVLRIQDLLDQQHALITTSSQQANPQTVVETALQRDTPVVVNSFDFADHFGSVKWMITISDDSTKRAYSVNIDAVKTGEQLFYNQCGHVGSEIELPCDITAFDTGGGIVQLIATARIDGLTSRSVYISPFVTD